MYEQAQLLREVLDTPDADQPRSRYADCIEAAGDGGRAAFIRIQLEEARLLRAGIPVPNELVSAAVRLENAHGRDWVAPIRERVVAAHFYRGFVEHIEIDAATFLEKAPELYALAPIRRLTLREPAPVLPQLCNSPHLDRIVSLELQAIRQRFDDEGLRQIYSSPHMQRLVYLGLDGNRVTEAGVEALAASGALPNLRELELRSTPAKALAEYVEDDAGLVLDAYGSAGAAAIDAKYGRKTWLHPVEDNQRRRLDSGGF
ncbi:MAG: TIGR02996 domain-containing protein [Deltaproteobacteria bacterium]|nr:TIGR02996 domain-containing protein [Deltaproteobacteria bacterium]